MDPNNPEMLEVVEQGVQAADNADLDEQKAAEKLKEEHEVSALWKEYEQAREFDKTIRAQYAVDRRYAAGTANLDWAVSANLIGAFIDILVSFLYARNPDVSAKKAPRVDNTGTQGEDDFAKTMQLIVSALWKRPQTALKTRAREQVRSTLTTGVGWLKVIMVSNGANIPQLKSELDDVRDNIKRLEDQRRKMQEQTEAQNGLDPAADPGLEVPGAEPAEPAEPYSTERMEPEKYDAEMLKLRELEDSVANRLEVAMRKCLAIDFVSPEDMQVSLDVRNVLDHKDAGWNANAIYRPVSELRAMFPDLAEEDVKAAKHYYQRATRELEPLSERVKLTGMADGDAHAEEAEQYTSGTGDDGNKGLPHAKVVELWNKRTGHVHTMIDGVKRWAKKPYQPDYASSRFYPYFAIGFYPVDGTRHPQSLPWRLMKLMDEYCSARSSMRLTRQRAVPGTIFNKSGVKPEDARRIETSVHQEFVGIDPTNPEQPLRDLFTEKPIAVGDMRLFDTTQILADMERISGVQEALQQSSTAPKTATEAEIQQSGFASRTTADRDVIETMMNDLAQYTAELAIQALDGNDAQRIAGSKAFWPHGMAIDDLLTMVEINIEAGTTGKPKAAGDKEAWAVILPTIKETLVQLMQAAAMGDVNTVKALSELVKETMVRMGDESDPSRFLPQSATPMAPPALPPMPGAPGAVPGDPAAGGLPPPVPGDSAAGGVPGVAPSVSEPPMLDAPALEPPLM